MKELPVSERPYERFLKVGPASLSDTELLAVLIRSGQKDHDSLTIARNILSVGGDISCLHRLSIRELCRIPGIGQVKAVQLKCVGELSNRMVRVTRRERPVFLSAADVFDHYAEELRYLEKEHFMCVYLDSALQLLGDTCISIGTVNCSLASSREIFLEALTYKAVHLMVLHNHPSGNVTPSQSDIRLTEKLLRAGDLLDITLLDHIIFGDGAYFSFKEHGLVFKKKDTDKEKSS